MLLPVALIALLLVPGVGLAGWAYAHRGYGAAIPGWRRGKAGAAP